MQHFLTKRGVAGIFGLSALYVRGMFERSDFPKIMITQNGRTKTVVDASDLVMFLNYTDILKNLNKICRRKHNGNTDQ